MSLAVILNAQRAWAARRGLVATRDYTATLEENLFQPLNQKTRLEFEHADGNELGTAGTPGKMCALRSSSALAANFFDYWRDRPLAALAQAFGMTEALTELRFEQKFPHGVRGKPPNVDVVLLTARGAPLAIESKFAEPYGGKNTYPPLDPKYFPCRGACGTTPAYRAAKLSRRHWVMTWCFLKCTLGSCSNTSWG